ncbi:MAG: signal peptidase I [Ruminococcaceae bacterium]|nr:signal peptidase I [Oscillospiraceae bacterium]MBQ2773174.1 signal peptidase I [Clostridia bacterium]
MTKKLNSKEQDSQSFAATLIEYVEVFVFAVIFVILLMTFCVRLCEVDGPSMNKTLSHGEKLIISDFFYKPQTGDIVVFHLSDSDIEYYNKPIVKRVIATEGQHVKIDYMQKLVYVSDDDIFSEDELLDESAYAYYDIGIFKEAKADKPAEIFTVPEDHLFVMGDNRNNSADSRNVHIGMVNENCVLGKALLRLSPFTVFK